MPRSTDAIGSHAVAAATAGASRPGLQRQLGQRHRRVADRDEGADVPVEDQRDDAVADAIADCLHQRRAEAEEDAAGDAEQRAPAAPGRRAARRARARRTRAPPRARRQPAGGVRVVAPAGRVEHEGTRRRPVTATAAATASRRTTCPVSQAPSGSANTSVVASSGCTADEPADWQRPGVRGEAEPVGGDAGEPQRPAGQRTSMSPAPPASPALAGPSRCCRTVPSANSSAAARARATGMRCGTRRPGSASRAGGGARRPRRSRRRSRARRRAGSTWRAAASPSARASPPDRSRRRPDVRAAGTAARRPGGVRRRTSTALQTSRNASSVPIETRWPSTSIGTSAATAAAARPQSSVLATGVRRRGWTRAKTGGSRPSAAMRMRMRTCPYSVTSTVANRPTTAATPTASSSQPSGPGAASAREIGSATSSAGVRHQPGEDQADADVERRRDDDRRQQRARHGAPRIARLGGGRRDRVEADVGEEQEARAAQHARGAELAEAALVGAA